MSHPLESPINPDQPEHAGAALANLRRLVALTDDNALPPLPRTLPEPTVRHSDDDVVDQFALAMKLKMAASRAKGRSGWEQCPAESLNRMLVGHIAKGDPVDVANFSMMLWARGERTEQAIEWPKARDVGRYGDMSPTAHLRVGIDPDGDVSVSVWDENGGASIEFCTPGAGGGLSSKTREALLALMVALEADNARTPHRDWWAQRMAPRP